jgi:hypothetical protein
MTCELWSKVSRSIVGTFPTEDAALAAVTEALHPHGRAYVENLAISGEDQRERSYAVAEGTALVELVLTRMDASEQIST